MADVLDTLQLRTLVAIAECGGFARAAAALHMSQPTVSQHVRLLEKRLGRSLVEKVGRQARFTVAGERLLLEARRILSVHDEALSRLDLDVEDSIIIGSTETAANQLLPELLASVRDAFPTRQVRFYIDRSTQMRDEVARGAIDMALILDVDADLPGVHIGTLPLNWYAAPGWAPPAEGEPWPLVAYVAPCGMRQRALQILGGMGRTVEVNAESTSLEGVLAAARAGLGVAVLPSAGRVPAGLELHTELPDLGHINLRLLTRRGLEPAIMDTAITALESFFFHRTVASLTHSLEES